MPLVGDIRGKGQREGMIRSFSPLPMYVQYNVQVCTFTFFDEIEFYKIYPES